jgi:hypothetical protein
MAAQTQASSTARLLEHANGLRQSDPAAAESNYRSVLSKQTSEWPDLASLTVTADEQELKDQEAALLKLGSLYRDEKYVVSLVVG